MDVHDVLSRLQGVKGGGGQWSARCPAHDDKRQSLSISQGKDGQVLLKCHTGCTVESITSALGIEVKDLFQKQERPHVIATYTYPTGAQKLRYSDKHFSWRHPDGKGDWEYNRKGIPHSLYVAGDLSGVVFVVEGEKDADNLHKLGYAYMPESQKYTEARKRGNRKWDAANLDRISIAVPKGHKEAIKAHAEAHNESVNGFINRAIEETMERDKAAEGQEEKPQA